MARLFPSGWRSVALVVPILACIGLYYPGLSGEFLFDDRHVVQDNLLLRIPALAPEFIIPAMESFAAGGRQLSMLTFALNYYFFGESVWWLKFVNVLIHCSNGVLIFFLTKILCRRLEGKFFDQGFRYPEVFALVTTAIWLVHPINLTSVLYISQRMTLLSAFFTLAGILFYIRGRTGIESFQRKLLYLPLGILGFTLIGVACKENAALLPLYIFLIELLLFRFRSDGALDRAIVTIFLSGFVLAVLALGYKFLQRPDWILAGYQSRHFTLEERVLTQFRALIFYIHQIIVPSNYALGLWHDDFALSRGLLSPVSTLWSGLGLLALVVFAFAGIRRIPLISLGILWFFVSHAIESTVIALEIMHEHRNYLASMGVILATVNLVFRLFHQRKPVIAMLIAGLFLYNASVLAQRSQIWANNDRLFEHEAVAHPESATATFQLGTKYYTELVNGAIDAGPKAYEMFARSASIEKRAINADLGLIVISEYESIDYDPQWMIRARDKLVRHPKEVSSQSAMLVYLRCLGDGKCEGSRPDADILFSAAFDTGYFRLMSLAATYYAGVGNDQDKAEDGFAASLTSGDALTWINYLEFLIKRKKITKACSTYQDFTKRWDAGGFSNSAQYLTQASNLNARLSHCVEQNGQS